MAVKPPEPLGCVTGFRRGWEGPVCCSPAVPPSQTTDPHLHNPRHFWGSEVPPSDRCQSCWHSPRHPIYLRPSQSCSFSDTKHSLKPFCYHTDLSPENVKSCNSKEAVPSAKPLSTERYRSPSLPLGPRDTSPTGQPALRSTPRAKPRRPGAGREAADTCRHPPLITRGVLLQPFVETSGKEQRCAAAHPHARCPIAAAWPPMFYTSQCHLSLLFLQARSRTGSTEEQTASL